MPDTKPILRLTVEGDAIHTAILDWTYADQRTLDEKGTGWNLFYSSHGYYEIERDDEAGVFGTDDSAIVACQMKAEQGDVRGGDRAGHSLCAARDVSRPDRRGQAGGSCDSEGCQVALLTDQRDRCRLLVR